MRCTDTDSKEAPLRWLLRVDEAILWWIRSWEIPQVTRSMRLVTKLGDGSNWTLLALALLLAGGEAFVAGTLLAIAALTATAFAQLLKRWTKRTRPSLGIGGFIALAENPDEFSFPSGHTAAATAVAIALLGFGHGLGLLFSGLALAIGISRIYLGAHYPLDVIAGACVGMMAGALTRLWILLGNG